MNRIYLLLVVALPAFSVTGAGVGVWAQEPEEESSELALLPLNVEIMRLTSASPSDQRSFVVTGETRLDVHVRASVDELDVTVIGPGGEIIDEATIGSFDGTYIEMDGAETSASLFPGLVCDQPMYHYVFQVPLEPPLGAGTYAVHAEPVRHVIADDRLAGLTVSRGGRMSELEHLDCELMRLGGLCHVHVQ